MHHVASPKEVRCRSMTIAGVAFLIGCVWQVAAKRHVALLLVGRIFWGVGVGFADQSVTIYNAEMAPPQWRGLLHILFQLATVTGKLLISEHCNTCMAISASTDLAHHNLAKRSCTASVSLQQVYDTELVACLLALHLLCMSLQIALECQIWMTCSLDRSVHLHECHVLFWCGCCNIFGVTTLIL